MCVPDVDVRSCLFAKVSKCHYMFTESNFFIAFGSPIGESDVYYDLKLKVWKDQ